MRMGGQEKREEASAKKKYGFILFSSQGHLHIDLALFEDISYVVACI